MDCSAFYPAPVSKPIGWKLQDEVSVVLFNTLLVGVLMVCLGFIALYIGNIRDATLNRPSFVIQKRLQQSKDVD